jgi:alkanesulfonate monooxygenase SsuD/methylene tetrahydromethanopterin reductase-like flavin-dependent oxidoreductase (luciferase family)
VKLGLTLPSFVSDPSEAVAVAQAAEHAGIDGVFVYDHLFRTTREGHRRPALEPVALLGAVCAATERITVGTLVARASLRPPASLHAALATIARLAPGRLVAGIGAGDSQSQAEHDAFGVTAGTLDDRVRWLRNAVLATRRQGYPVWVAGHVAPVRAVAADLADGWNQWGGTPSEFGARTRELRAAAGRPFACTWGGLVVLGADDHDAAEKAGRLQADHRTITGGPARVADALDTYAAAGADWVVVAPLDSRDPANATLLGEQVRPRLAP